MAFGVEQLQEGRAVLACGQAGQVDVCAQAAAQAHLGQGHGQAAVGEVVAGVEEPAHGSLAQAYVAGLGGQSVHLGDFGVGKAQLVGQFGAAQFGAGQPQHVDDVTGSLEV